MLFHSLFPEFSGQDSGSFEALKLEEEPAAVPKVSEICFILLVQMPFCSFMPNMVSVPLIPRDKACIFINFMCMHYHY